MTNVFIEYNKMIDDFIFAQFLLLKNVDIYISLFSHSKRIYFISALVIEKVESYHFKDRYVTNSTPSTHCLTISDLHCYTLG